MRIILLIGFSQKEKCVNVMHNYTQASEFVRSMTSHGKTYWDILYQVVYDVTIQTLGEHSRLPGHPSNKKVNYQGQI